MLCIFFSTSLLCPCWILYPWCIYLVFLYRLNVGHANDTLHWAYYLACLDVHSLCEWSLWSLFIVIVLVWSSHALLLLSTLLDRIVLTPYAFQDFCLQWSSCVVVFKKYLFVWYKTFTVSRVRCEWVLATVPNSHVKSGVYFRVLSQNSQRGRL